MPVREQKAMPVKREQAKLPVLSFGKERKITVAIPGHGVKSRPPVGKIGQVAQTVPQKQERIRRTHLAAQSLADRLPISVGIRDDQKLHVFLSLRFGRSFLIIAFFARLVYGFCAIFSSPSLFLHERGERPCGHPHILPLNPFQ